MDYRSAVQNAEIPFMIFSPTIISDQRLMYISSIPLSYLTRPFIKNSNGYLDYLAPDAIEFMSFFKKFGAENLKLVTALRMNASFPYILPGVYMPTFPEIKIMDAGIRDNYGLSTSTRFYNVFRDWIDRNTSGVIFLQVRTDKKLVEFEKKKTTSFINEFLNPVANIYNNFMYEQEYVHDYFISYLENGSFSDINMINFIYEPGENEKEASMSLHITEKEKKNIRDAFYLPGNQENLKRLKELLK